MDLRLWIGNCKFLFEEVGSGSNGGPCGGLTRATMDCVEVMKEGLKASRERHSSSDHLQGYREHQ